MAGLDLSGVAEALEEWLVDVVQIVRDNGAVDDELDEETGDLTPADATLVYEATGMVQSYGEAYRLLLPLDADVSVVAGDLVRVAIARNVLVDPRLTGRRFRVAEQAGVNSLAVATIIGLDETTLRPEVEALFPDPTVDA